MEAGREFRVRLSWVALVIFVACLQSNATSYQRRSTALAVWTWSCDTKRGLCKKALFQGSRTSAGLGLEACRLTCGPAGALWPLPTGLISIGTLLTPVDPTSIAFTYHGSNEDLALMIREAVLVFQKNLKSLIPTSRGRASDAWRAVGGGRRSSPRAISITAAIVLSSPAGNVGELTWDTDESYSVTTTVQSEDSYVDAVINATTFFGFRHGLETLSQLVAWDSFSGALVMAGDARVLDDSPTYPHRGLLLDPARNFIQMDAIFRQVDAMASCKMNVLHLHLTDTQSFPYTSRRVPFLTAYGALPGMAYSTAEVRALVSYARIRGVRVLPELDAPAHAGAGWDATSEALGTEDLAVCVAAQPWRDLCIEPPCGQLNPVNPDLYTVLGKVYADMMEDFGVWETPRGAGDSTRGPLLHMGGDEVHIGCWNSSAKIVQWMESNGLERTKEGFLRLWADFQEKALLELDKAAAPGDASRSSERSTYATAILWTSDLTDPELVETFLNKSRYVIQAWMPASVSLPLQLLDKGYRLIFSTKDAWYLDHGFGNWKGSSTNGYPFHPWQVAYDNSLPREGARGSVLGGEATLWGEMVDSESLDAKAWPRAAATAERLWSDPAPGAARAGTWQKARVRMMSHRERLVARGVKADALQPRWCLLNEGECF